MRSGKLGIVVVTVFALAFLGLTLSSAQEPVVPVQFSEDGSIVVETQKEASQIDSDRTQALLDRGLPIADTDGMTVTEYVVPVSPINLLVSQGGDVWFCSFGNSAIGKLEIATGQVLLYIRPSAGDFWGLKQDSEGNLWYTTVNADAVGRFEPSTNTFVEWAIPETHFGLELDPATGDVWFATHGEAPGIHRLSPASNHVTAWSTRPYADTYDLDIAPDGDVWFTVQPAGKQGLGRLDPTTDQITIWVMPIFNSCPFRVIAETDNSIWFTEFAAVANSIAQLVLSTNTLNEFRVPTPGSNPWSLLRVGDKIWFTEYAAGSIGRLDPALTSPTITVLSPVTFAGTRTENVIVPSSYVVAAGTTPSIIVTAPVTKTETAGFTEFALSSAHSKPLGMALDPVHGYLWFTESATHRIGRLVVADPMSYTVLLPLIVHNYVPPVTFPLHIGDTIPMRPVAYQGEVFYTQSVQFPHELPVGGHFYFSSEPDGVAEALVDDALVVLVDGVEVFTYDFSTSGIPVPAIVELPRATMEQLAGRTVTIEYRDVYGEVVGASSMWLIWTP